MSYIIKKESLTTIADSIREKTGKTELLSLDEMPAEIAAIETGVGLNFEVVGGTTQPSSASENTIWVNTNTAISSWIFSSTEPTGYSGLVWIFIGTSSPNAFNALKENGIQVYPRSVKQYISGKWEDKTSKVFLNGVWNGFWNGELYDCGNEYEAFTGGWEAIPLKGYIAVAPTVINVAGGVKIEIQDYGGAGGVYKTRNKINLDNFSTLYFTGDIKGYWTGRSGVKIFSDIGETQDENVAMKTQFTNNDLESYTEEALADVSSLTGDYYIAFYFNSCQDDEYTIMKKLWLE